MKHHLRRHAVRPGALGLVIRRLRSSFALEYEAARVSAEDVMVNLLALSRVARSSAEIGDFGEAARMAGAVCALGENLALPELAMAGQACAEAAAARTLDELRVTAERLVALLESLGATDAAVRQTSQEDPF